MRFILGIFLIWAASSAPAHAYLDPGTGSIVLQALIGGIAAGYFLLRHQWQRFLGLFRRSSAPGRKADGGSEK